MEQAKGSGIHLAYKIKSGEISFAPWRYDLADYMEKRKQHRYKIRWPITIYTKRGPIKGESRNVTGSGIFIHCQEKLSQDEVYRMVIRFPQREPVEVKGRLVWSNLEGVESKSALPGMGFSFVELTEEDRHHLDHKRSPHPGP